MALNHVIGRNLRRDDLPALLSISKREWVYPDLDQIARLKQRGFVVKKADGSARPTIKGRVALWLWRSDYNY